jgi:ABC-type molybdenum transport system ATPase subunit/photorepair protein PhrA
MTENESRQDRPVRRKKANIENIKSLVADLGSQDGQVRVRARKSLVAIGGQAVKPLVKALASKKEWVRWEAAKTLGQIGDPAAVQALVKALEDKMFDVRWLAAEGLISTGREALVPLLRALIENPDSLWLKEGVHHVLHDLDKGDLTELLQPVIIALEGFEPSVEAPLIAETALKTLIKE